jgi:hypothetical protein
MSDKLNLIFFRMPEENSFVKELSIYYRNKEGYYVEFIDSVAEANQYLATERHGILIFEVKTKLDLQNSVAILKAQRKAIKSGTIKPACILHVKNKKVEKILAKYGCQDLLDDDITSKTLSFKVDCWSRGLKALLHKQEKEFELKKSRAKAQEVAKEVKSDFKLVEPLELKSDIWLLKANSDYKKILRRWLLRVLGPSPYVGNWVELEPQPGDRIPTWKFVTKNDDGQFILEDGAWFFSGSKPEFDWQVKRWNFSSEAPHLYFYTQDAQVFSRFKFELGVVKIAENSQYALTKEQMILESCDNKFNIEGDEAKDEESANIEGDSETDKLGGQLEGEAGDSEGDLGGHMSGKLRGGEDDGGGHYEGSGSTDKLDHGPLSGKGYTDQLSRDPLSGQLKPQTKAAEGSNRSELSEEDDGGHYGGEASTNNIPQDPSALDNPFSRGAKEFQENVPSSRTPLDNGVKDGSRYGRETHLHNKSLEAKTGKELWDDSQKKPVGTVEQVEDVDRDDLDVLAKNTIIGAPKVKGSVTSANPSEDKKKSYVDARVSEMEDALGGGLTDSVDPIVGSEAQLSEDKKTQSTDTVIGEAVEQEDKSDLSTMFSAEADVDTESGDLKVILKQSTKAGNDITFICSFEDFYEDELVVVAPKDSLKEGSEVKAKVSLAYGGKKVVVYAQGSIEEIEEYNEKKEMLVVSIEKIDSSLYQDFMSLYQDRQKNIDDFMVKAKGLEGIDEAS